MGNRLNLPSIISMKKLLLIVTLVIVCSGFVSGADSLSTFLREGKIQLNKYHYDKAREFYEAALRLDSNSFEAISGMGVILSSRGRTQEAIKYLEKAYRINPQDPDLCNNLGALMANEGKSQAAIKLFNEALRYDTLSVVLNTNLAQEYLKIGQVSKALPLLSRAYKLKPEQPLISFLMANGYAASGASDSAEYYYLKALEVDSTIGDPELFYRLGTVQGKLGKGEQSRESFLKALELKPDHRDCSQALAMHYLIVMDYSSASKHFASVIEIDSTYYAAWIGMGAAEALQDNIKQADEIMSRLFDIDSAMGYQLLSMIRAERKRANRNKP